MMSLTCVQLTDRILSPRENKKLMTFERSSMESFMSRRQKKLQENIDFKVTSTSDRSEVMGGLTMCYTNATVMNAILVIRILAFSFAI